MHSEGLTLGQPKLKNHLGPHTRRRALAAPGACRFLIPSCQAAGCSGCTARTWSCSPLQRLQRLQKGCPRRAACPPVWTDVDVCQCSGWAPYRLEAHLPEVSQRKLHRGTPQQDPAQAPGGRRHCIFGRPSTAGRTCRRRSRAMNSVSVGRGCQVASCFRHSKEARWGWVRP